jgi:hypothetical protein
MDVDQAQSAVTLSAFVVAGVYGYRKLIEPTTGQGTVSPTSHFVIGWGFVYITLSLIAQGAPELGGMLAILVMVGDLLAQGTSLTKDLTGALKATKTATGG